ncbi:MAG: hypothetical protein OIF54_00945 [Cohaesibacter sp.]|nr:hypothetical protein [Cohaesibacter sp.]
MTGFYWLSGLRRSCFMVNQTITAKASYQKANKIRCYNWTISGSRQFEAWNLRRRLKGSDYEPDIIEAAEAAAKAGKSYEGILAKADKEKKNKARREEMRKNPPKAFGSAR